MSAATRPHEELVVARGPRISLRLKRLDDAPDDLRWNADEEIARLNHREATSETLAQYAARLENELRFVNPRERTFAIDDCAGNHIGNAMYYNVPPEGDRAEIGITIGSRPHRYRGLGREAVVALLRYLFQSTAFRSLTLHTLASNAPARRCFLASGFEETGEVERQGARLVAMAVRREYWLLYDSEGRFEFIAPRD